VVDASDFRATMGLAPSDIALVTVSRLVDSLKGESIVRTMDAVAMLGNTYPLRLLIVGDGTARSCFAKHADAVNARLGRHAVTLVGAMLDPRPAYAAADIAIGMGGSALRSMAFAKPTIVVGEQGFSKFLTEDTADEFLYRGLYGVGNGIADPTTLAEQIRTAIESSDGLSTSGHFAQRWVSQHFSLDVIAARLSAICHEAVCDRPSVSALALDVARTAAVYLREQRFLWRAKPAVPMQTADATTFYSKQSRHVV
jgi:L-malate glycosyltransferase